MAVGLPAMTGAPPPEGGPPPKLLDRVRPAVRLRHYSRWTEKAYVDWIRRYILFHQKKHPSTMGATEIVAFLSWLAVDKQVSASTQNQALSAVLFLYKVILRLDIGPIEHVPRARMPDRLPVVLSREEIGQLMKHVDGTMWLIVALLSGTGVRLRFFGITIRMFMEVGVPHHRPHFHAAYQDAKAVFALEPVECIGGDLPRTQQRLVEAWAEIHLEELLQDWKRLQCGQPPLKIEPLR